MKIEKNWEIFFTAWKNGNPEKCADFFTENGLHFRPGASIDTGKVIIQKAFTQILNTFKIDFCNQKTLEIEAINNKVLEYGTYQQKWNHQEDTMQGSYFAVWKENKGSLLKLDRLIFN